MNACVTTIDIMLRHYAGRKKVSSLIPYETIGFCN
jgi:hypothetical protein